jgi:hypothetical protein
MLHNIGCDIQKPLECLAALSHTNVCPREERHDGKAVLRKRTHHRIELLQAKPTHNSRFPFQPVGESQVLYRTPVDLVYVVHCGMGCQHAGGTRSICLQNWFRHRRGILRSTPLKDKDVQYRTRKPFLDCTQCRREQK